LVHSDDRSNCHLTTELSGRARCPCRGQTRPTMCPGPLQRVVRQLFSHFGPSSPIQRRASTTGLSHFVQFRCMRRKALHPQVAQEDAGAMMDIAGKPEQAQTETILRLSPRLVDPAGNQPPRHLGEARPTPSRTKLAIRQAELPAFGHLALARRSLRCRTLAARFLLRPLMCGSASSAA